MAISFFCMSAIIWSFNPLMHRSVLVYGVHLAWLKIVISRCLWAKMTSLVRRKTSLRIGMRSPQLSYSSRYIFLDFSTTKTACPHRYNYSYVSSQSSAIEWFLKACLPSSSLWVPTPHRVPVSPPLTRSLHHHSFFAMQLPRGLHPHTVVDAVRNIMLFKF